jgi:glyoxylase-like metal-dependent hydrolase (beta-lactamase superfamily II)
MSVLTEIGKHVYWMSPGEPDRPSLCAVVGDRRTLMLDAGSSSAHARQFLDALQDERGVRPYAVAYTHSDWDHVLGGAELDGIVMAHALTAGRLDEMAAWDWSDAGLDSRVAAGLTPPEHVADIKDELPTPRHVHVAQADIVFHASVDVHLGGATVHIRHVGGDHGADSCVMLVEPERLLFLGDCLSASHDGMLTTSRALPLYDAILEIDAELYVEGHNPSLSSRTEIESLIAKARAAENAVGRDLALTERDEDTLYFLRAFRAGRST